ncbi:MAG TPA: polysaccharide biosynthesis tyrosine autokinase, partial [Ferruginibacter sp.]|nr:polysaccharide biosynthesis tyrosine autokinase [Ferruginibacter sp.]
FHFIAESIEGNAKWGEPFYLKGHKITVEKREEFNSQTPIFCHSRSTIGTAFSISKRLQMTTSKESNIINISYSDVSSDRAIDILRGLTHIYNLELQRDKSQSFSQAINFIDQRLIPLGQELDSIESALAAYKASKGFVGTSANGELYLEKMKDYDKQLTEVNILKSTVASIERFINDPKLKESDLSFVGVNDPYLQGMLTQFQELRSARDKASQTQTDNNPNMQVLDRKLADLRSGMYSVLQNYKNNLRIAEDTYQANIASANSMLRNTPTEEKMLLEKSRLQNIKEQLFLILLQKREEASIAKASVTVNTKLLSPPVKLNAVTKPSRSIILSAAIILGLLLPVLFAIVRELANKKIISKKQLQSMTHMPVLAELEQADNNEKVPFVIGRNKRSMFGEQIRSLRTNINFYRTHGKKTNYVLITSSVSGEGKSFLSMNLAKSYALQGKKVALLEFDLRRPKITKAWKLSSEKPGLSSVLIGKVSPAEIAIRVSEDPKERLDFYPAGAIPPNPQELISGEFIDSIKKHLDQNYDVVVIDPPPFGIVADAQILGEWADVTLIVTRFQQTVREQIQEINEWYHRGLFKSMALVFNGVKDKGYFGSKYGNYYYKRRYGYGYYSSTTETEGEKDKS